MSGKRKNINIFIGILLLILGIAVLFVMIKLKKAPEKKQAVNTGAIVATQILKKQSLNSIVEATGEVIAAKQISIIPQVKGIVVQISPKLIRGGFFKKNELLFQIDKEDYIIAAEKAKAAVSRAENDLLETEGKAKVALKEWEIAKKLNNLKAASPLVLYEPQLKKAKAYLLSARADLKQAELNIKRTSLKAPFNCIIISKQVEYGEFVSSGMNTAVISGTDSFDISVSLPYSEIMLISFPDKLKKRLGSYAEVSLFSGNKKISWNASVKSMFGNVDTKSRMPGILLSVEDPYNLKKTNPNFIVPLAEGSFVKTKINGKKLEDIFIIPPEALRINSRVWIYSKDNTLDIRTVSVLRKESKGIIIKGELKTGEKLIISQLSGAAKGMKLREIRGKNE